jgi:hypothetical protein
MQGYENNTHNQGAFQPHVVDPTSMPPAIFGEGAAPLHAGYGGLGGGGMGMGGFGDMGGAGALAGVGVGGQQVGGQRVRGGRSDGLPPPAQPLNELQAELQRQIEEKKRCLLRRNPNPIPEARK